MCLGAIPAGSANPEDMFAIHLDMGPSINIIDLYQLKPLMCFVNGWFFQDSIHVFFSPFSYFNLSSLVW